jgi:hypothetical protein
MKSFFPSSSKQETNATARIYQPLAERQFRVLRFLPGITINATLKVLDIDQAPKYLALSYTWGPTRGEDDGEILSQHGILVNGMNFSIRANLHDALIHMLPMLEDQQFPLFVDAICINQRDEKEKATQVKLMRWIYDRAAGVHGWLGVPEADIEAQFAIEAILDSNAALDQRRRDLGDVSLARLLFLHKETVLPVPGTETYRRWLALADLLTQNYWGRTWIMQEATGPARTSFWFGKHRFDRDHLKAIAAIALEYSNMDDAELRFVEAFGIRAPSVHLLIFSDIRNEHEILLKELYYIFRHTRCSDSRDKVFAARGLATDIPANSLLPDYTKSFEDVFTEVATYYLSTDGDLDLLGYVDHDPASPNSSIPSWVPDWRRKLVRTVDPISGYNACGEARRPGPLVFGRTLSTNGKRVDTIQFRTWPFDGGHRRDIQKYVPTDSSLEYIYTQESKGDAFLRTVVGDKSKGDRGAKMDWSIYDDCQTEKDEDRRNRLDNAMLCLCTGRSFCTTTNNYMGVFPAAARVGDIIVVLVSGNVPYVLRHKVGDRFKYIGACYVHGIMDGEAMRNGRDLERFVLE